MRHPNNHLPPQLRWSESFYEWLLRPVVMLNIACLVGAVTCWHESVSHPRPIWLFASLVVAGLTMIFFPIWHCLMWVADLIDAHRLASASFLALVTGTGAAWYSHPLRVYAGPSLRAYLLPLGGTVALMGLWGVAYCVRSSRPAATAHQRYPRGLSSDI
jgi:hypothetical protein